MNIMIVIRGLSSTLTDGRSENRTRIALSYISLIVVFVVNSCTSAHAEVGPCKPLEKTELLICGEGKGAAIVVSETTSPSGKLALAWRNPNAPPTEQPDDPDPIELLIIRLADGAVLAKTTTDFWDTGNGRANRMHELAVWSPDSHFLIRYFDSRFSTDIVELYAIGADDAVSGPFDLLKPLDTATRTRLKTRVKGADDYAFSLSAQNDEKVLAIDNRGRIRAEVMLWVPKPGPFYYYTLRMQAVQRKTGLDAHILSLTYRGMEPKLD
jgi:hypothetical protein